MFKSDINVKHEKIDEKVLNKINIVIGGLLLLSLIGKLFH